jgi:hypothetical protein
MKPPGFQLGEVELEEIDNFNWRLQVTGHDPAAT